MNLTKLRAAYCERYPAKSMRALDMASRSLDRAIRGASSDSAFYAAIIAKCTEGRSAKSALRASIDCAIEAIKRAKRGEVCP